MKQQVGHAVFRAGEDAGIKGRQEKGQKTDSKGAEPEQGGIGDKLLIGVHEQDLPGIFVPSALHRLVPAVQSGRPPGTVHAEDLLAQPGKFRFGVLDDAAVNGAAHDGQSHIVGYIVPVRLAQIGLHSVAQGIEGPGEDLHVRHGRGVGGAPSWTLS